MDDTMKQTNIGALPVEPEKIVNGQGVQTEAFGASGTEIYSGYISEEYLQQLTGYQRATEFDRMRRSDAIVKMLLSAMKLPIKSANWYFMPIGDSTPESDAQKKFFEYIFFEDFGQSFTKWLGEVLTCIDFGYSLFEIIHKVSLESKIGPHIGIKKVAFRSQKTIHRWDVDEFGNLRQVEQITYGDNVKKGIAQMQGEFLIHFCPEQEGDDYEGLAVLRPCYGAYQRKNLFLKLIAAGTEKYAFKTPVASVPAGKEQSDEKKTLESVLKKYVSNQSNYIIKPDGWTIELLGDQFDSEKVRTNVDKENMEMVNSILAGFLLLGQNGGGGSHALSEDLSTFFGASIQYVADHISEVISEKILKPLLKLNFPDQDILVTLSCDSLKDDANSVLATTLKTLKDGNLITPDSDLEAFIREKYKLPVKMDIAQPPAEDDSKQVQDLLFAEDFQKKDAEKAVRLMNKTQDQLESLFSDYLAEYAASLIDRIMNNYASASDSNKHGAIKGVERPVSKDYLSSVLDVAAGVTNDAVSQMTQFKKDVQFDEISNLPRSVQSRLKNRIQFLLTTQKQDLEKAIILQYQNSVDSTDSAQTIKNDLMNASTKVLSGPTVKQGASVMSNDIVQSARLDALSDSDAVESWTFIAEIDDNTTDICRSLNDRTFSADDPDLDRYRPPLHFNCRSVLVPNKSGYKGNPTITTKPLSLSSKAQEQIQFKEEGRYQECGCGVKHP